MKNLFKNLFDEEVIATYAVFNEIENEEYGNLFKRTDGTITVKRKRSELKEDFYEKSDDHGLRNYYKLISVSVR